MREVGVGIGKGAELDHGVMVPQCFGGGQNAKSPLSFQGDLQNVDLALTRFCAGLTQVFLSGSNHLERLGNLVAGVGFEPTTFRL